MMVLVSYDVCVQNDTGARRLRRIARACLDYGQSVQYSVFEIEVTPAQWAMIRRRLLQGMDPEIDSLRFYFLGKNWQPKVEHIGAKAVLDLNGPLIF